jgi:hypothetical protein
MLEIKIDRVPLLRIYLDLSIKLLHVSPTCVYGSWNSKFQRLLMDDFSK